MAEHEVSSKEYEQFKKALQNLREPSKLINSPLLRSCVVFQYQQANPNLLSHQTLREAFEQILEILKESQPELADLLYGRFWEGYSNAEMRVRSRPWEMERRTFNNYQQKAIHEFAFLFLQQEKACKNQKQDTGSTSNEAIMSQGMRLSQRKQYSLPKWLRRAQVLKRVSRRYWLALLVIGIVGILAATLSNIFFSNSLCGESTLVEDKAKEERFLPYQGVTSYTIKNTPGGILNNRVRAVEGTSKGVIVGYFKEAAGTVNGLSYFVKNEDKNVWANCNESSITSDKLVNALYEDDSSYIWMATDGGGVLAYDGKSRWQQYTTQNAKLDSDSTYSFATDSSGNIWVTSLEGVSKYQNGKWELVYDDSDELYDNQTHNVIFDSSGNIWVGHISKGVSLFDNTVGKWEWLTAEEGEISDNNVRSMVLRKGDDTVPESIWIGTLNGLNRFETGELTIYHTESSGLPSSTIQAVTVDRYQRVWVGTDKGVAYYDGAGWIRYNDLNTWSIDFSPGCLPEESCPLDDHVWTGTEQHGLTHSRLPYPTEALDITQICFKAIEEIPVCSPISETFYPHVITVTYQHVLQPGKQFYFEIEVSPRSEYTLRQEKGDFLSFVGENSTNLFGAYPRIPVEGIIESGQHITFSNRNNMFTAPALEAGKCSETYVSPWRVWMHTRYAGPEIRLTFTVEQEC